MSQTKDIRDAVERELSYDPLVDDSDISVKNISGDVALNGTVPSYPQYLEAAAAARRVAGVDKLQNHLEVVLPAGDYRDDATLTTVANDALTLNIAVPDGVEATASNGNLTLTGTVRYGSERTAAEQAVTYLTGVRNVKDDIAISTDADPVRRHPPRPGRPGPLRADPRRQRRGRRHQRQHRDADRPRPHLGRARRGARRGVDGHRRLRRP